MKCLTIARRQVFTSAIESVLLTDSRTAAVWLIGKAEPLYARPAEVPAIQRYVIDAQYGEERVQ